MIRFSIQIMSLEDPENLLVDAIEESVNPIRSKLAAHHDVIAVLRVKKRKTYQQIADFLKAHNLDVSAQAIHKYWRKHGSFAQQTRQIPDSAPPALSTPAKTGPKSPVAYSAETNPTPAPTPPAIKSLTLLDAAQAEAFKEKIRRESHGG